MNDKIKELGELNIAFYELFCKYDNYKDKLSEPMAKYMAEKLFSTYKLEFERIFSEYYIDRAREKFETDERRGELVPRRWRAWWSLFILRRRNKAAALLEKTVEQETEKFFDECAKKLAAEREPEKTVSQTGVNNQSEQAARPNVAEKKPAAAEKSPPAPAKNAPPAAQKPAKQGKPAAHPRDDAKPEPPKTGKEKAK